MTEKQYVAELTRQIREAMERRQLSYRDMERASGVPFTSIHQWLTGRRKPGLYQAIRVCEAMGLVLPPVGKKPS